MEFRPPINERETVDLLKIIEAPEDWQPEALEQARLELNNRGINTSRQLNHEKSAKKFLQKSLFIKANATFSKFELLLILILGPLLFIFLNELILYSIEWEYKKKRRQAWIALILGFGLWFLMLIYVFL